uniref:GOST seven transmembrane domain-containing protein n=1 Tax=Hirondellea gigas TaxID=1518452 RepID=A0A6A7G188_9CRUS
MRALYYLFLFVSIIVRVTSVIVKYGDELVPSNQALCHGPVLMVALADAPSGTQEATFSFALQFDPQLANDTVWVDIEVLISREGSNESTCAQIPSVSAYGVTTLDRRNVMDPDWSSKTFTVTQTGFHFLSISNHSPKRSISFTGESVWKNPFGQLSGDMYGFLPFYGFLSLLVFGAAIIWTGLNIKYRHDLLQLQHYLSIMIGICIVEFSAWYLFYDKLNTTGESRKTALVVVLLLTVLRRAVSRILVVAVSMGFGVVEPTLPKDQRVKLLVVGGVYFVAGSINEVVTHYGHGHEVDKSSQFFLIAPSTILDAIFYWWIFTALADTLSKLKDGNQTSKLVLYNNFSRVLACSLAAATIMALYTIYWMNYWMDYPWMWSQRWFVESGFWQMLYVAILMAVMVLWRPSSHQRDIAFHQQIPTTDDLDRELKDLDYDDDDDDEVNRDIDSATFSIEDIEQDLTTE